MRVELRDISKHYGPVRANDGVCLTVAAGELHGILGENGAGKTTLMKILAGFTPRTSGEIWVDGMPVACRTPAEAARLGIGMLYQDPLDFPNLTVLDNFQLGLPGRLTLDRKSVAARLAELSESLHFDLQPAVPVKTLTVGERQQLELVRLLALGVDVLILDEPTTGISSSQKEVLFSALRRLAAGGKSVLLVSHKLEDVEALCDRLTVLRLGRVEGSLLRPFSTRRVLEMMFGEPPVIPEDRGGRVAGREVLALDGVSGRGGRAGLSDCSVVIREGEVVGLAGLEGSGQEVFLRLAAGLTPALTGSIHLCGRNMAGCGYHDFRRQGVAFVPAARLEEALIPGLSIAEHLLLQEEHPSLRVRYDRAGQDAASRIEGFRIKGLPQTRVEALSGGNQQRLLLSFLPPEPLLLALENPTRGLDAESVNWVWEFLKAHAGRGTGIVFSSSEVDEIMTMADRVLVFFNGRIIKDVLSSATDIHALGKAIAGAT
jgi:simple sugar transport system ATP-binding protein